MARVIWSPEALARLDEIHAYIAQRVPDAAAGMIARLFEGADSLSCFPGRGRPASNGARELPSVRLNVIRYEHDDDTVRTLGIRHGRQQG